MARGRNIAPLPLIKPHCGLRLPPDRYCLVAANYKLRAATIPKKVTKSALESRSTIKTTLKSGGNAGIKRPTITTVPKTQAVSIPKPVFKFSTTPKTVAAKPVKPAEIKMEVDEEPVTAPTIKRRRSEEEFEMVG